MAISAQTQIDQQENLNRVKNVIKTSHQLNQATANQASKHPMDVEGTTNRTRLQTTSTNKCLKTKDLTTKRPMTSR